ncbi:MAG: hypothetical protein SFY96_04465 [Planctomycetota bacterium]|nr:hypothetical protein [Planctomycetota bacterium]
MRPPSPETRRTLWVWGVAWASMLAAAAVVVLSQSLLLTLLSLVSIAIGIALALRRAARRNTLLIRMLAAVLCVAPAAYHISRAAIDFERLSSGNLLPSDYPRLRQRVGDLLAHFPPEIPTDASEIHLTADGPWGVLPAIDYFVELKFKVSPERAKEIAAHAAHGAIVAKSLADGGDGLPPRGGLANEFTGDPQRIECYVIIPAEAEKSGGVCIDRASGDVLYWVTD